MASSTSEAFYIEIDFRNFITFSQSKLDDFFRLDCDKLKKFLSDERLVVKSDKEVFEALEQWVMHSPDDRFAEVPKLLPCIRLGQLDPFYLAGTVKEFANKGGCASMIELAILRKSRRLDQSDNSEFRKNPRRAANRFTTPAARKEYESPDPNKLLDSLTTAVAQATTAYQNIEQTNLQGKSILTSLEILLIEARKYVPLPAYVFIYLVTMCTITIIHTYLFHSYVQTWESIRSNRADDGSARSTP